MAKSNIADSTAPQVGLDLTPTGLKALTVKAGTTDQMTGSDGADRAGLFDIEKDRDQVINLGDGADVFVFGANTPNRDLNGIVKMGNDAAVDRVFLSHQISDYEFTLRSDGSLKILYLGEDGHGDAVTFYGAEEFTFRNVDADTGVNYSNTTVTYDQLVASLVGDELTL